MSIQPMTPIAAFFYLDDDPDDKMDGLAFSIFEAYGGKHSYQETTFGGPTHREREIGYEVPNPRVEACRTALKEYFRLESTPRSQ